MSISKPSLSETWASTPTAGDVQEPADGIKLSGWTADSHCPPYQWFNWLLNKLDTGVRYLLARGIPDYDVLETYSVGDRVQASDGQTYKCIQANTPAAAKSPATQRAYWTRWGGLLNRGIPDYDVLEDYAVGDRVQASDGETYKCIQVNGPSTAAHSVIDVAYWGAWPAAPAYNGSGTGITLSAGSISSVMDWTIGTVTETGKAPLRMLTMMWTVPLTSGNASVTMDLAGAHAFATGITCVLASFAEVSGSFSGGAPVAIPTSGSRITVTIAAGAGATSCLLNLAVYGY
jgi:hypothetical protein